LRSLVVYCLYSESAAKYRLVVEMRATIAATDSVYSLRCERGIFMMIARRMAARAGRDPAALSVTSLLRIGTGLVQDLVRVPLHAWVLEKSNELASLDERDDLLKADPALSDEPSVL
jgi:hypothetical protein